MGKDLKVLMIGTDRNLLVPGSAVSERLKEYGALVGELHIVLLCDSSHGLKEASLAPNVHVYPTNSSLRYFRPYDAARIGKKIVFDKKFVRGKSIITAQDPFECGLAGLKVKNKWRLPLEVQLHTDPFSPYFSGWLNALRKRLARKVLRHADSVRAVSEALLAGLAPFTQADISVLPIYVDKKRIEDAKLSFDIHARYGWHFIVLAVSRLSPEKNLSAAIEALAIARTRFPATGMVIVGSGPEEGKLKALVKKLKLEGAVEFAGWQEDLASFYKTANAFIQTSLFEGYGLSLVEAGLSGLPVLTTPVGIARELEHGKDAYIYQSSNPELFAGGIVDLVENNIHRENLRINLKRTLDAKLLTKEEYMARIQDNWEKTALKIKS